MPRILAKSGNLPASHAVDGAEIVPGHIFVAPPDHHLLLHDGVMQIHRGPKINSHRPAIDPLFGSAADSYPGRVTAVLLSGMDADGFAGLLQVKARGGLAILQSPEDAEFPYMLEKAIDEVKPHLVLPAAEIGAALQELALERSMNEGPETHETPPTTFKERSPQEANDPWLNDKMPSPYSCPDCGGVLWEETGGQLFGYRCRVGHVYSYDALLASQTDSVERALWAGLRALEEKRSLLRRLAEQTHDRGLDRAAARFEHSAGDLEAPAELLRDFLMRRELYELPQRAPDNGEQAD